MLYPTAAQKEPAVYGKPDPTGEKRGRVEKGSKKESQKSNGVFKVIAWLALVSLFLIYAAAVGAVCMDICNIIR